MDTDHYGTSFPPNLPLFSCVHQLCLALMIRFSNPLACWAHYEHFACTESLQLYLRSPDYYPLFSYIPSRISLFTCRCRTRPRSCEKRQHKVTGPRFQALYGAKTLVISSMIHFHAFQLSKTCFECPIRRSYNSQSSPHGPTDRVGEPKGIKKKRPKSGRTHVVLPNHVA